MRCGWGLKSSYPASCAAAVEEIALQNFYKNTREQRVRVSQRMHRAPFSKIFIATPFNHRRAGLVGGISAEKWL